MHGPFSKILPPQDRRPCVNFSNADIKVNSNSRHYCKTCLLAFLAF